MTNPTSETIFAFKVITLNDSDKMHKSLTFYSINNQRHNQASSENID